MKKTIIADDKNLRQEGLLSCGEFAKLCQVKKQTLFHYDDIGLLRPESVNDKGYRFYTYKQYETFTVISSLKEAGLSLEEIKEYLGKADSEKRLETMREAQRKIEEKIAYLTQVQTALYLEIDRAEEAATLYTDEIQIMMLPKLELIRSERLETLDDIELIHAVKSFASTVEVVCAALDTSAVKQGDWDRYAFMLAFKPSISDKALRKISEKGPKLIKYLRPAGDYVVAYHKGAFENASTAYDRLLAFCDENNLKLGRYAYEEYLRGELTASNEEDYLTRICIQVTREEHV